LVLIASVFATLYPYVAFVNAQNQATVNVLESIGGSTDPLPGTYNYNDGTQVTLTATPDQDLVFVTWLISTDASNDTAVDNPYLLNVTGGVTYSVSAVFAQLTPPTFPNPPIPTPADPSIYGFVTILQASGGRTQPAEGTYYFTSVYKLKLTAIVQSGWKFSYWVISGDTNTEHGGYPFTLTPTDNPYTFDCGLGYSDTYQPVFTPVGATPPITPPTTPPTTPLGISTELIIAIIAIIIAIVAVIASVVYVSRSKK
jgi:hypothetical protein